MEKTEKFTRSFRVIYTCKRCKKIHAYDYTQQVTRVESWSLVGFRSRVIAGTATRFNSSGVSVSTLKDAWCQCGGMCRSATVKGTKTETPCDDRCTLARGHRCECSCSGKNHGIAHTEGFLLELKQGEIAPPSETKPGRASSSEGIDA